MARENRPYWIHSSPDAPADDEGMRRCARGDFCSMRVVTFTDGERVVTPALTPRPYCDLCSQHIARCAADLPEFWVRLSAMIGDPLVSEIPVRVPFGPQVPLREDVDAWLRLTAVTLGGWAARVRAVARLSAPQHAHDRAGGIHANADVLARHTGVLIALQPGWMTRTFRYPLADEDAPLLEDAEIVRVGAGYIELMVECDGEDAGRELLWAHYRARSLLLETNPPPELLIPPCRNCTWRSLRRAYPDTAHEDIYSRCDRCADECTWSEYEANAKRWLAYHRAHERVTPVLADVPAA